MKLRCMFGRVLRSIILKKYKVFISGVQKELKGECRAIKKFIMDDRRV